MPGSSGPKSLEGEILAFLSGRRLEAGRPALVGLSGGADSTALLAALAALGAGPLRAVHVDHGLRPRAELDEEFALVRALCRRLGLPLTVARVRPGAVAALARATGEGIEAAARRYRYAAFRAILAREGLDRLYLAHTLDDQLETLLMRRLAGAGGAGGRGIPAVSGPILRPFLGLRKDELLAYLAARDIPYATDSTNASPEYLRNRTRLLLVPLLDQGFPGWRGGLLAGAGRAAEDEAALAAWAERIGFAPPGGRGGGEGGLATHAGHAASGAPGASVAKFLTAPAAELLAAPEAVATRAVLRAASALAPAGTGRRRSHRFALAALAALRQGGSYRGSGLEFRRDGELLVLRALDFPTRGGYFLMIDRPGAAGTKVRLGRLAVAARWTEGPGAQGIREDCFAFPLVVRSRRPGDTIALPRGRKPLDELLSEWRVPERARALLPLVEDRDGIVAVLGAAYGGKDRYRHRDGLGPAGRFLAITVKGALA